VLGAVGGQPDVLSSVDVALKRHSSADIDRHSDAAADIVTLFRKQSAGASQSLTVHTVVTVEAADNSSAPIHNGLEPYHDGVTAGLDSGLSESPVDPSMVAVR